MIDLPEMADSRTSDGQTGFEGRETQEGSPMRYRPGEAVAFES